MAVSIGAPTQVSTPEMPRVRAHTLLIVLAFFLFVQVNCASPFNLALPPFSLGQSAASLRWAIMGILAAEGCVLLLAHGGFLPMPWALLGLLGFSVVTFASCAWSEVPLLSFYKAVSFALLLLGLVLANGLVLRERPDVWLRFLVGVNLSAVAATVLVLLFGSSGTIVNQQHLVIVRGPFISANSLGSVIALTLPAVMWWRERGARLGRRRLAIAAAILLGVDVTLLYLSHSRASILATLLMFAAYSLLRARRFGVVLVLISVTLVAIPQVRLLDIYAEVAYKGTGHASASFITRRQEFQASLSAAGSEPLAGHGFGISAGLSVTEWKGQLQAYDANREKTTSLFGTIEEVGVVGAIPLFLALGAILVGGFGRVRRTIPSPQRQLDEILMLVILVGVVHSEFEAWLTSAGSFEAFIFWGTVGVAIFRTTTQAISLRASDA